MEEPRNDASGVEEVGLNRRDALKGAVAAGLGLFGLNALAACSPSTTASSGSSGNSAGGSASASWDKEVDVVVVGTGTAVVAAIAVSDLGSKNVLLVEKDEAVFGGTSGTSGGGHAFALIKWNADEGINDTRDKVLQYMKEVGDGRFDPEVQAAFVDTCDEFTTWINGVFGWSKWGHFNKAFGDYYELYSTSLPEGFGRGSWYPFDGNGVPMMAPQQWPVYREYVDTHDNMELMMGTTAKSLITDSKGAVIGIVINDGSKDLNVKASAVILGTGGFEHNEAMRRYHLPFPYYRSNGFVNNTGDGQRMGAKIGAQLAYMDETFGCPHVYLKKDFVAGEFSYDIPGSDAFAPRGFPYSLMVNRKGRRFHDESTMYATANRAFGFYDSGTMEFVNIPGFWIADSKFAETFVLPGNANKGADPDYVFKFNSLEELADGMGIDKEALLDEVATFNKYAAQGEDPIWHRGKPNSNHTLGMMGFYRLMEGATCPTSVLGTVDTPPFYCCRYVPGMMGGTRGGLHYDANAQVVDVEGKPIPGLYAVGNCSSGIAAYWAGGSTLGQGVVMGYRAAKHICGL